MSDDAARLTRMKRALELDTLEAMKEDAVHYENTKNPLFAWQSLASWFALNRCREQSGQPALPMPDWCVRYFSVLAARMACLHQRRDFHPPKNRVLPDKPSFPRQDRLTLAVRIALGFEPDASLPKQDRLTAAQAMKRANEALGLKGPGWNAFDRSWKLRAKESDEQTLEMYRSIGGKRASEAMQMLLKDRSSTGKDENGEGIEPDVRGIEKRIAAARRARKAVQT